MAKQGQKPHSSRVLGARRDESCSGAVGRAYRREQVAGRQRWVVIGDYCDGCNAFWLFKAKRVRPVAKVVSEVTREVSPTAIDDEDVPDFVRYMRGEM